MNDMNCGRCRRRWATRDPSLWQPGSRPALEASGWAHLGLGGSAVLVGAAHVDAVVAARAAEAGIHVGAAEGTEGGWQVGMQHAGS